VKTIYNINRREIDRSRPLNVSTSRLRLCTEQYSYILSVKQRVSAVKSNINEKRQAKCQHR